MAYIEAVRLGRTFKRGNMVTAALKEATFSVAQGEMVAIVGRSGSGKSTLMNLLGCLDSPTAGSYRLNGQEVARLSRRRLAEVRNREIGFVFQQFHLVGSLTAVENVELPLLYRGLPRSECRHRAEAALYRMGLGDRMNHRPTELSGGQQQRIAIARAVVGNPSLLLADEPTGNLDSAAAADVMRMLRELNRDGRTVLLITHDQTLADALPRRVTLRDGVLHG